jgi:hypothetical protein
MAISIHEASSARFAHMLRNLAAILDKAQAHCEAGKIEPAAITAYRLFPDMLPFTRQVQIACDSAKGAVARLAGVEVPKHEDSEQTFAELKARVAKTLEFIESIRPGQLEGAETREVVIKLRGQDTAFRGAQYLLNFALPNFHFHVATAYDILRHNGVPLGKRDFLGNPLA